MYVSINGPESGTAVTSKVENLHSEFGPSGSRVIRYVREGQTDGQTDRRNDGRTKAKLTAPFRAGGSIISVLNRSLNIVEVIM